MKLFYYKDDNGNFGDAINEWLWEELIPGIWNGLSGGTVSGIGTILGSRMPHARRWIVMSSGAGYSPVSAAFLRARRDVICVRGPLTAAFLGIDSEKAVTDGAILLSLLPRCRPAPRSRRHGIVFMPHHKKIYRFGAWKDACDRAGIEFLAPSRDSRFLVERIRHARLVLADAMHAAIVADTLRVPWIPVRISAETNDFKWLDWTLSMEVPYIPVNVPPSSLLEWLWSKASELCARSSRFPSRELAQVMAAESRLDGRDPPMFGAASGGPCASGEIARNGLAPRGRGAANANRPDGILAAIKRRGALFSLSLTLRVLPILDRIFRFPVIRSIRQRSDDRHMERAVAGMRAAAAGPVFLSRPDVFMRRKIRMKECLETLRVAAS